MKPLWNMAGLIAGIATAVPSTVSATEPNEHLERFLPTSAYGCQNLEFDTKNPILEGDDGVFYRFFADLRMYHPFSDRTVELVAELSDALEGRGTTLVFLPVPAKSISMPEYLPKAAALYGFQPEVAAYVYQDVIQRLETAGVASVDAQTAMASPDREDLPFFRTDFHWSAEGARLTAQAVAERIHSMPDFRDQPRGEYVTEPIEEVAAFSSLRREIQRNCIEKIPDPLTMTWSTTAVASDDAGAALDLFGDAEDETVSVTIAGTSFSDIEVAHFDGWLAQYSGFEIVNQSITGGNQFGAMISYLTSDEYREEPPDVLIWETPIYNNLLQYGEQPMRELIAAAGGNCEQALPLTTTETGVFVDLGDVSIAQNDMFALDTDGVPLRDIAFKFTLEDGSLHNRSISRGDRLRANGRFYISINDFGHLRPVSVDVVADQNLLETTSLHLCSQ